MPRRAAFLLGYLAVAAAQERPFRAQTRVVQVPAVVTDKNGHNIDGLLARDFTVLDNGVRQEITVDDFATGLPPISLVIAMLFCRLLRRRPRSPHGGATLCRRF